MSPLKNNIDNVKKELQGIKSNLLRKTKFTFDKYYYISYMIKEENVFNIYETVSIIHPFVWLKKKKEEGIIISILSYQGISEQDFAMYIAVSL